MLRSNLQFSVGLVTMLCVLLGAVSAAADDAAPKVDFSGFVDLFYAYNANDPASGENFYPGAGTTAKLEGELGLNLAQVQWTRPVSEEQPVGFTLALVAGEGTEVVHAGEPDGGDKFQYVYQASAAYRLKNGVVLEAGIYPSHIGMEGFYSKDNWNYTRSIIGEASPYYQTGVKASWAFNEHWSGRVDLLNGWQVINDNNDSGAIGAQLAYSGGGLNASLNAFVGPELAGDDDSMRNFVDLVMTYEVTPKLRLGATVDVASQERPDTADAEWWGAGVYMRYAPNERHAIALRAERLSDPDNGITGAAQEVGEVTLTWEMRPRDNVIVKIEARHDDSDADVFGEGEGLTDSQFLAVAGVVVTF